jgi:GxxExxY protein
MKPNEITHEIIGAAIEVHREIGPGQDEVLYEDAMELALHSGRLRFRRQPSLPVYYKGVKLDCGFRPDFVVEEAVVAEIKAAELVHPVFEAQVRTYQRLGGWSLGLLLNFNVPVMKEGISRFIVNAAEFRNTTNLSTEVGRTQRKDDLLGTIIGAAIEVQRILGVGLLNSVYSACFQHELSLAGLRFEMGRPVDAFFQGNKLSHPGKLGLVVEGRVLVSILSVPKVLPVHEAQARSEMRLGGLPA